MKTTYVCRMTLNLDVKAFDKEDAYETLQALADVLREGDADGLRTLLECQIKRCRPTFDLSHIQELPKPPAEPRGPEPVTIVDPSGCSFDFSKQKFKP